MCGRYVSTRSREDLVEEFEVGASNSDGRAVERDYNVAPTKEPPVVLVRVPGDDPDAEPVRQLRHLKWGLVPSWSREARLGRMINARAETVAQKPSFRKPFAARRLIVPVDGFYEWLPTDQVGKSGKPLKQPYYLHPTDDGHPLAVAGIYDFWRDKTKGEEDPDRWLATFAIITTSATDDVGRIHDRMPMTVPRENWAAWLDPGATDADEAQALMGPPPSGDLDIYPITTRVNNVRNNGPELLKPLHPEPAD